MNTTKIEWCDKTWNPITGCLHDCEYCYARKQVRRFEGWNYSCGYCRMNVSGNKSYIYPNSHGIGFDTFKRNGNTLLEIDIDGCLEKGFILNHKNAPYPIGFSPTFHGYRLGEPSKIKKPQNIFVCSMADLFGEWVPDAWINAVFEACKKAPQHRYLFLTKNSKRFRAFQSFHTENIWFGQTITGIDGDFHSYAGYNTLLSIEPILGEFKAVDMWKHFRWVIIGAETGNRKGKIIPKREWIVSIVDECRRANVPVFLKNSLREIWQDPLIQEYPW